MLIINYFCVFLDASNCHVYWLYLLDLLLTLLAFTKTDNDDSQQQYSSYSLYNINSNTWRREDFLTYIRSCRDEIMGKNEMKEEYINGYIDVDGVSLKPGISASSPVCARETLTVTETETNKREK
ncbi:hypothetical protein RND71_001536 [Anisodus tanguticus]|uniref:Uncharacterized protein n=1 Tax=Anisodus tanguticus TaxID=243964 RepID=A0AAE1VY63_9SOLA|nr:hypothetical protein RND71_001536 [Anisodus tanguticus]